MVKTEKEKAGWKNLPEGDVLEAGTAKEFKTGDWRTEKPVWDIAKCKQCMLCWVSCPDSSILVSDGKMTGIDYDHCKGCGICAKECPFKAIVMEIEKK